jgi:hypothetical protein
VLPTRAAPGAQVTARITLINDGYAAPAQNRPVRLILAAETVRQTVTVNTDVRTWKPGKPITLTVRLAAPRQTGAYALSLSLPDPATRLATDPAYAVRLANDDVWDATRGTNTLGTVLSVARQ